jgi:hypothetical protein
MGEKQILTVEMIDETLKRMSAQRVKYIDPMKLAEWTLETCCAMVDDAIVPKTIERAIANEEIPATKAGKRLTVEPAKFLLWYRKQKR